MPRKEQTPSPADLLPLPVEVIERRIYFIRSHKVMLDSDLAELYQVATRVLNQAVRRNLDRFPPDFMFQLTAEEAQSLRSQVVTLNKGRGQHRKYLPYVFTEQGVAMLSSVLNSDRAIQVNIAIMRAFVQLRSMLASNEELNRKLSAIERTLASHEADIKVIFVTIKQLMAAPTPPPPKRIGFHTDETK